VSLNQSELSFAYLPRVELLDELKFDQFRLEGELVAQLGVLEDPEGEVRGEVALGAV